MPLDANLRDRILQAVSDVKVFHFFGEFFHEGIVNTGLHQHAVGADTGLT